MPGPREVFMGHKYISKDEGIAYLENQMERQTAKGLPLGSDAAAAVLDELKGLNVKALTEAPFDMMAKIDAARTALGY